MESAVEKLLADVEVLEPVSVNDFQIFGLRRQADSPLQYITLDEALQKDLVEVTEVDESGSVPTLKVLNKGSLLLFLMAGEQLKGAKQNRVLNVSIMVPSQSEIPIPVSCVEAGRWNYTSRKFESSGTASHSALRKQMSLHSLESYRISGTPSSKQGEVWLEVTRKLGKMGSKSSSSSLNQVYEDYESRMDKMMANLKIPAGCSGAVFAFGGRIVGMDLFDQTPTFEKLWPKLVRSYAIDAMEQAASPSQVTADAVSAWLKSALKSRSEKFRSPGLGDDLRFQGEQLSGSSLVLDGQPVHTELFAAEKGN